MYGCAHCGQLGISQLRKMLMGPALPHTCRNCGKKTGVPYSSLLNLIPGVAGIASMMIWPGASWTLFATGFGLAIGTAGLMRVPLVKR